MVYSVSVLIIEAVTPFGYTGQQAGLCASVVVFSEFIGRGNYSKGGESKKVRTLFFCLTG